MAWVTRRRADQPDPDAGCLVGLEWNSTGVRGVALRRGQPPAVLPLDDPHAELPAAVSLARRPPEAGRAGLAYCRSSPHLVCREFLPFLGQPREWRWGRVVLDASSATRLLAERLARPLGGRVGAFACLPPYLSLGQVSELHKICDGLRLPPRGSAVQPLALAAWGVSEGIDPAWAGGDGSHSALLVIDADDFALTAAVVTLDATQARLASVVSLPRLGVRSWKERLLDGLADRCIRVCRRDPRDDPDAEQRLYDQLDDALDRTHHGQRADLEVRSSLWLQSLAQQPHDLDAHCRRLAVASVTAARDAVAAAGPVDVRAAWLTHAAGRLPGLARELIRVAGERVEVRVLQPDAPAHAAAVLGGRWLAGELPRVHLDTAVALARPNGGEPGLFRVETPRGPAARGKPTRPTPHDD